MSLLPKKKPKKKKAKTSAKLKKEALILVQRLARLEAADDDGYCTCCTCGKVARFDDGMHGGHFIGKGHSSRWALDLINVHPQCAGCNLFKMDNGTAGIAYTLFMVDWYGREQVEHMKQTAHIPIKRTTQEYRDIVADFKESIKLQENRLGI